MLSMQNLLISQLPKKQPETTDRELKLRQNYAPFISKSPRFQVNKMKPNSLLPQITTQTESLENQRLHTLKTEESSNQSQFFFKSRISRFSDEKSNIPTSMLYSVSGCKQTKQTSPCKQKFNMARRLLSEPKTIPSIPDCRNKFGYNWQLQRLTLVQKSQKQLERERSLMKEYKESLVQQKILFKRQQNKELSSTKAEKQFSQRAKRLLQKQNLHHEGSFTNDKNALKPKYSHLYKWKPEGEQTQPRLQYFMEQAQSQNQQKKMKFQFFNSCQKRFKDNELNSAELSKKPNVRLYLQKMLKCKNNEG